MFCSRVLHVRSHYASGYLIPSLAGKVPPRRVRTNTSEVYRMRCSHTPRHLLLVYPQLVGALKSIYEMKCALLDKILNFGTQIVKIFLYRNFNGSKLVRPVFGRHLGFKNGRHLGPIFSNISKRKTPRELITSWFSQERTLSVSRLT